MFVSFLYRLKKEINWFKKNQKEPFFIFFANYSFLNAYVDIINVRISLKSEVYTFDYEEFDKIFCFVKQDLMNAKKWLEKAAKQDHAEAKAFLSDINSILKSYTSKNIWKIQ